MNDDWHTSLDRIQSRIDDRDQLAKLHPIETGETIDVNLDDLRVVVYFAQAAQRIRTLVLIAQGFYRGRFVYSVESKKYFEALRLLYRSKRR